MSTKTQVKRPTATEQIDAVIAGQPAKDVVGDVTQETTRVVEVASEAVAYRVHLSPETYYRIAKDADPAKLREEAQTLTALLIAEYGGEQQEGALFEVDERPAVKPTEQLRPIFDDYDSAAEFLAALQEHLDEAHQELGGTSGKAFDGYIEEYPLFGAADE